jgi:hypothetical protein
LHLIDDEILNLTLQTNKKLEQTNQHQNLKKHDTSQSKPLIFLNQKNTLTQSKDRSEAPIGNFFTVKKIFFYLFKHTTSFLANEHLLHV